MAFYVANKAFYLNYEGDSHHFLSKSLYQLSSFFFLPRTKNLLLDQIRGKQYNKPPALHICICCIHSGGSRVEWAPVSSVVPISTSPLPPVWAPLPAAPPLHNHQNSNRPLPLPLPLLLFLLITPPATPQASGLRIGSKSKQPGPRERDERLETCLPSHHTPSHARRRRGGSRARARARARGLA